MTGRGTAGLVYSGSFHQLGVQLLGLIAVGVVTFSASYVILWVFRRTWGIRVSAEAELSGLDLHEHGSSGYDLGVLAGLDERPAPGLAPVPATAASTTRR